MSGFAIDRGTFETFHAAHGQILQSMRTVRPIQRELEMLFLIERMLLHLRLAAGLGDPGSSRNPATPSAEDDPDATKKPESY